MLKNTSENMGKQKGQGVNKKIPQRSLILTFANGGSVHYPYQ